MDAEIGMKAYTRVPHLLVYVQPITITCQLAVTPSSETRASTDGCIHAPQPQQ